VVIVVEFGLCVRLVWDGWSGFVSVWLELGWFV